jgi:hypothetical protein
LNRQGAAGANKPKHGEVSVNQRKQIKKLTEIGINTAEARQLLAMQTQKRAADRL